jgi:hypothetical protein
VPWIAARSQRTPSTPKSADPPYRRLKRANGKHLAFVDLDGRRVYLGAWESPESKQAYQRLLAERRRGVRMMPEPGEGVFVSELLAAFLDHARTYYRDADGNPTRECINIAPMLRMLRDLYGDQPASSFDARALKNVRPSRTQGLRLVFAEAARRSGRLDPSDEVLASAMVVTLPLQAAVFDVLVHRSIPQVGSASAAIYSPLDLIAWVRNSTTAMPVEESCRLPFEREPRAIESPRLPLPWRSASGAYGDALAQAVAGLGRDLSEYTILRIEVPNPPLHGLVVLRWRQR